MIAFTVKNYSFKDRLVSDKTNQAGRQINPEQVVFATAKMELEYSDSGTPLLSEDWKDGNEE